MPNIHTTEDNQPMDEHNSIKIECGADMAGVDFK